MRLLRIVGILSVLGVLFMALSGTASASHQIDNLCVGPIGGIVRDGSEGCASYEDEISPPVVVCVNPLSRVMRVAECAWYEFPVFLEGDGSDPVAVNPLSGVVRYTSNPAWYEHAASI